MYDGRTSSIFFGTLRLDPLAKSKIGKRLRDSYDAVVNEPIPDKFLNLLASLEAAEKTGHKDGDS